MLELEGLPQGLGYEGLRFMKCFNDAAPLPIESDVIVIGGGFTAVDCARTSRRLLGPDAGVSIMYRRGEGQMSANAEELREMREEGVRIETLVTPLAATLDEGQLRAITFCRNVLGPDRDSGKPDIRPVPGSEFDVPCRTLIFSIGQSQDTRILPQNVRLAGGHLTTVANLFVAGDYSSGNADVISAIGDGKAAADEIDVFLSGRRRRRQFLQVDRADLTGRLRDHDLVDTPPMPMLALGERGRDDEVELGFGSAGRRHPRLAMLPVQLQIRDRPGQVHPLRLVHQGFAAKLHLAARRVGTRRRRLRRGGGRKYRPPSRMRRPTSGSTPTSASVAATASTFVRWMPSRCVSATGLQKTARAASDSSLLFQRQLVAGGLLGVAHQQVGTVEGQIIPGQPFDGLEAAEDVIRAIRRGLDQRDLAPFREHQ